MATQKLICAIWWRSILIFRTKGPPLNEGRSGHACGVLSKADETTGAVEKVRRKRPECLMSVNWSCLLYLKNSLLLWLVAQLDQTMPSKLRCWRFRILGTLLTHGLKDQPCPKMYSLEPWFITSELNSL